MRVAKYVRTTKRSYGMGYIVLVVLFTMFVLVPQWMSMVW